MHVGAPDLQRARTGYLDMWQCMRVTFIPNVCMSALLQAAYARLTLENTNLRAEHARHMAEAENAAADRRVSFEGHMAKAKHDAGGMKVSLPQYTLVAFIHVWAELHARLPGWTSEVEAQQ